MQVLFVASEGVPFVKTGGLADVIGSLPKALQEEEVEVRVILPKYKAIPAYFKKKMYLSKRLNIKLGWRNLYCGIEELEYNDIHYYFIDNEFYFKRDEVYGYGDSFDEGERFAYFNKAVLEVLPFLDFKPDILHLNDWQTGLISLYLESEYRAKEFYQDIKTIFTIHNLKYQGNFPRDVIGNVIDIDEKYFTADGVEYYGRVNFMKAGLIYSDYITTVSDTYAKEIQYPFFGYGMEGILRKRRDNLFGIRNGIDTASYNPKTDPHVFVPFDDRETKLQNKLLLQDMLHLQPDKNIPMMAMISRLVPQKGLDLVIGVLEEILAENLQLVILGTGEKKYEHILGETAYHHSDKMYVHNTFDETLSRKIFAGSDSFLMPSLFEPCGISQLIALRYLSVPIVRETGGLKDSVHPFNEYTNKGNGFSFANYNAHDMLFTIRRAIQFYQDQDVWHRIITNIKEEDYGWTKSAREYKELYAKLLSSEREKIYVFGQSFF